MASDETRDTWSASYIKNPEHFQGNRAEGMLSIRDGGRRFDIFKGKSKKKHYITIPLANSYSICENLEGHSGEHERTFLIQWKPKTRKPFSRIVLTAETLEDKKEIVTTIRRLAKKLHTEEIPRFHPGKWTKRRKLVKRRSGYYSCCRSTDKENPGCVSTLEIIDDTQTPSPKLKRSYCTLSVPHLTNTSDEEGNTPSQTRPEIDGMRYTDCIIIQSATKKCISLPNLSVFESVKRCQDIDAEVDPLLIDIKSQTALEYRVNARQDYHKENINLKEDATVCVEIYSSCHANDTPSRETKLTIAGNTDDPLRKGRVANEYPVRSGPPKQNKEENRNECIKKSYFDNNSQIEVLFEETSGRSIDRNVSQSTEKISISLPNLTMTGSLQRNMHLTKEIQYDMFPEYQPQTLSKNRKKVARSKTLDQRQLAHSKIPQDSTRTQSSKEKNVKAKEFKTELHNRASEKPASCTASSQSHNIRQRPECCDTSQQTEDCATFSTCFTNSTYGKWAHKKGSIKQTARKLSVGRSLQDLTFGRFRRRKPAKKEDGAETDDDSQWSYDAIPVIIIKGCDIKELHINAGRDLSLLKHSEKKVNNVDSGHNSIFGSNNNLHNLRSHSDLINFPGGDEGFSASGGDYSETVGIKIVTSEQKV